MALFGCSAVEVPASQPPVVVKVPVRVPTPVYVPAKPETPTEAAVSRRLGVVKGKVDRLKRKIDVQDRP